MREAPVKLRIRKGGPGTYEWRTEREWPIRRTRWTKLYLDPVAGSRGAEVEGALAQEAPRKASSISYSASAMTKAGVASASWTSTALAGNLPRMGVSFESAPLTEDTEVTGPVALVLWVSSTTEDMDIFATIRNIPANSQHFF